MVMAELYTQVRVSFSDEDLESVVICKDRSWQGKRGVGLIGGDRKEADELRKREGERERLRGGKERDQGNEKEVGVTTRCSIQHYAAVARAETSNCSCSLNCPSLKVVFLEWGYVVQASELAGNFGPCPSSYQPIGLTKRQGAVRCSTASVVSAVSLSNQQKIGYTSLLKNSAYQQRNLLQLNNSSSSNLLAFHLRKCSHLSWMVYYLSPPSPILESAHVMYIAQHICAEITPSPTGDNGGWL
ncbi:hypothetical protein J6590_041336 [Homalodisca vitripennis]|nr:hypothetical protein J6590_041336 [Homalodisca vitripennis]